MTHEEAVKTLTALRDMTGGLCREAVETALDVMERDRWISVEEPPEIGWYLVRCNQWGGSVHRVAFSRDGIWTEWTDKGYDITKYVTHWMPLPEPPKEDHNGE